MLKLGRIGDRANGGASLRSALAVALAGEHIAAASSVDVMSATPPADEVFILDACRKLGERTEHDQLMIMALVRLLQRYGPTFTRVGARAGHGDHEEYGCWVDEEACADAVRTGTLLRVASLDQVPRNDAHPYVLMAGAGRVELHVRSGGLNRLVKVWNSG